MAEMLKIDNQKNYYIQEVEKAYQEGYRFYINGGGSGACLIYKKVFLGEGRKIPLEAFVVNDSYYDMILGKQELVMCGHPIIPIRDIDLNDERIFICMGYTHYDFYDTDIVIPNIKGKFLIGDNFFTFDRSGKEQYLDYNFFNKHKKQFEKIYNKLEDEKSKAVLQAYINQKISGKFEFINGRIVITNMIVVCEDVTAVTGKLEVDGSVHVIGSIHSGGYIKASGDIIVEYNVETAKLIAGGNVMIKKGSCSKRDCFIEAGGEVSGSFFEAANITAGGNVKANYIMNSNIRTMGRVIVSGSKGILLGGSICAVKGVDTYNLGNSSHIKTLLDIGRNELYEQEQIKLNDKREIILNAISALEEGWNKMLKHLPAKKELAEETLKKLNATIVAKDRELANLDAEISKLANMTDQDMKAPVCVRGNAYPGSVIIINSIKYMLPSDVNRIIFKLRNKTVVMVKL